MCACVCVRLLNWSSTSEKYMAYEILDYMNCVIFREVFFVGADCVMRFMNPVLSFGFIQTMEPK